MTAKRFIIMDNLPKGTHSSIWDKQKQHNQGIGDELWLGEVVAMLNEGVILVEEIEQLKFERDRYKRLSEIRQESINNRILTIKEFIDNCSDKKVKKTLEQLFHSEVNEYDLSKKIRKLEKENEQLKHQIETYKSGNALLKKTLDKEWK